MTPDRGGCIQEAIPGLGATRRSRGCGIADAVRDSRVAAPVNIRDPRERRGERSTGMSGEWEYDPYEYAEELAAGEDLGRSDLSSPEQGGGRARAHVAARAHRQGWRRCGSRRRPGCARGPAAAASGGSSEVDANGKFTGTLRVLSLGVEFPIPDIAKQASKDLGFTVKPILAPSEKQPQIAITSARHVRRLRRLQLPVAAGLAVRRAPAARHTQAPSLEGPVQAVHARQAQPGVCQVHVRPGQRALPDDVRRSGRLDGSAAPTPTARRATGRSSAGSARTASRSAGSRSPAGSSAPRRTSTPTRWATTPT